MKTKIPTKKTKTEKSQLFWKLKIIKIAGELEELEQNEVTNGETKRNNQC